MKNEKRVPYRLPKLLYCNPDDVSKLTIEDVKKYIKWHEERLSRYIYLENLYMGFHDVFKTPEKEKWKPDWRLAVNFPRYITDTFLGFAYGIPITKVHIDESVNAELHEFERINEISDHEYELAKYCCIYGHAWEYFYQNEKAETKLLACTPKELFTVYDDTVQHRALFSVRYGYHWEENCNTHKLFGEVLFPYKIISFDNDKFNEEKINPYGRIPVVEWTLNTERLGLFENVSGMIELYNHTIGEKANDVDSFAEAYLAVLGAELDDDGERRIRDARLINVYGTDSAKDIIVQFMQKPTADGTQENLLDRLERLIYQTSMVANISDETFGSSSSGKALQYKLLAMRNLAATFDRKIEKSLIKRYKLWSSLKTNTADENDWKDVVIKFNRNLPTDPSEEVDTAVKLEGLVSQRTQLSTMPSIVPDPDTEMDNIKQEKQNEQSDVINATYKFGAEINEQS